MLPPRAPHPAEGISVVSSPGETAHVGRRLPDIRARTGAGEPTVSGDLMAQIEQLKAQVEEVVTEDVPSLRTSHDGEEDALGRMQASQDTSHCRSSTQPPPSPQGGAALRRTNRFLRSPREGSRHQSACARENGGGGGFRSAHHKEQQKMDTVFAHTYEEARARTSTTGWGASTPTWTTVTTTSRRQRQRLNGYEQPRNGCAC